VVVVAVVCVDVVLLFLNVVVADGVVVLATFLISIRFHSDNDSFD